MTQHIQITCGISASKVSTILYEDNVACITQINESYTKGNRTKHTLPKFFLFIQELEKNKDVDIQYVRSSENATNVFTKALPTIVFRKLIRYIKMHRLRDL